MVDSLADRGEVDVDEILVPVEGETAQLSLGERGAGDERRQPIPVCAARRCG